MRWPLVRKTHPNYFTVLVGEAGVHAGLAASAWFGSHTSPVWYYLAMLCFGHGVFVMGLIHFCIFALMVGGFYHWPLMRAGLLLSIGCYAWQTSFVFAGVLRSVFDSQVPRTAYEGIFYGIGLAMLSTAAYREPVVPGRYDSRDEA